MKAQLPHPEHYSYLVHRKQRNTQVILPVILSALLMIGMVVLISFATFKSDGDVGRWAAISTIWIIIPILLAGLIVLALLIGGIYLMARALGALPHYTALHRIMPTRHAATSSAAQTWPQNPSLPSTISSKI